MLQMVPFGLKFFRDPWESHYFKNNIPGVRGDEVRPPRDLGKMRGKRCLQVEAHLLAARLGAVALLDVELPVVRADVEEGRLHVEVGSVLLLDARHLVRHGGRAEEIDGRRAALPGLLLFSDVVRFQGGNFHVRVGLLKFLK